MYFAQDFGCHRGLNRNELESPRAFHCQEALGQRDLAQLELDTDWQPEPQIIGNAQIVRTTRQVQALVEERREGLEDARHKTELGIERFC